MKKIIYRGEEYFAEKIIKTDADIVGYNGNIEVFAFRGISDFSLFKLEDGQEFDKDENQIKLEALAQVTIENKKKDVMIAQLASTVANLTIEINKIYKGSVTNV